MRGLILSQGYERIGDTAAIKKLGNQNPLYKKSNWGLRGLSVTDYDFQTMVRNIRVIRGLFIRKNYFEGPVVNDYESRNSSRIGVKLSIMRTFSVSTLIVCFRFDETANMSPGLRCRSGRPSQ